MENNYKLIDGVLYKAVDTSNVKTKIDNVVAEVQPYADGIVQCERQIAEYKDQITSIISRYDLDPELVKAVAPDKVDLLGF